MNENWQITDRMTYSIAKLRFFGEITEPMSYQIGGTGFFKHLL